MNRWLRFLAPAVALAVVLVTGIAALGGGAANAKQESSVTQPAAAQIGQPTTQPQNDAVEQQDGAQNETQDANEVPDAASQDGAETPDNEAADAAALASKATITVDQAKAIALAANPSAKVNKIDADNENGTSVYDVELSTGVDVKVDAKTGTIVSTDQTDAEAQDEQGTDSNQ